MHDGSVWQTGEVVWLLSACSAPYEARIKELVATCLLVSRDGSDHPHLVHGSNAFRTQEAARAAGRARADAKLRRQEEQARHAQEDATEAIYTANWDLAHAILAHRGDRARHNGPTAAETTP